MRRKEVAADCGTGYSYSTRQYRLAGFDIGNRILKCRSLLLDQCHLATGPLGRFIDLRRLGARLDLANDDAVADNLFQWLVKIRVIGCARTGRRP
jgi:hypothetical protein